MESKNKINKFTDQIAVIGGGRWSRVLLQVLCKIVPSSVEISSHSKHNVSGMIKWSHNYGFNNRIKFFKNYPKVFLGKSCAIIVANAARDHEKVVKWAVSKYLPVLVEKPIALNYTSALYLANLAKVNKTYLAVSHVFLFAKYINDFSKITTNLKHINNIKIKWIDPKIENRYGEVKKYDPAVPIFVDWLPHIISILQCFLPHSSHIIKNLKLYKGGSRVKIYILLGNVNCEIDLVRNSSERKRSFEVKTNKENFTLDFANEPGKIISDKGTYNINIAWENKPKPLSAMLLAFLTGAAGEVKDIRLDLQTGLSTMKIIDEISSSYTNELLLWLNNKFLKLKNVVDSDLHYAFSEIIYKYDPNSTIPINQRIEYLYKNIKKDYGTSLYFENKKNSLELIRLIILRGKTKSYSL